MCAMKYGWRRRQPQVQISQQQINKAIQSIFPRKKLSRAHLLNSGLANTNYCCLLNDNSKILLRVYIRDEKACFVEETMHNLVKNDIPIAKIYLIDATRTIIPYSFAIMEWIGGILLRDAILNSNSQLTTTFFQLGFYLHHLQKFSFSKIGTIDKNLEVTPFITNEPAPFLAYTKNCLQKQTTKKNIGKTLCQKIDSYLEKHRDLYTTHIFSDIHLSHGDYNPANILICPKTYKVNAVLDWEFTFAGSIYCDMGNMLRDQHIYHREYIEQFVLGIKESGVKLDDNWQQMCRLIDFSNLIGFASTQCCLTRKRDVIDLIQRTISAELK